MSEITVTYTGQPEAKLFPLSGGIAFGFLERFFHFDLKANPDAETLQIAFVARKNPEKKAFEYEQGKLIDNRIEITYWNPQALAGSGLSLPVSIVMVGGDTFLSWSFWIEVLGTENLCKLSYQFFARKCTEEDRNKMKELLSE